ncbi:MAG: N-acetylmuramoyl-L-alanine amidase [Clostridia bacterium]|nr:N-acetylmuramoyl-L-alanine amidase [Clostridia bacterium]
MIKIFIDAGHNPQGVNAGAEGNGLREQDVNFQVSLYLAELLRENGGFEVMLSRPTPETSLGSTNSESLQARVRMANEWGADWFISIHCNAAENPAANGTEVYVYSRSSPAFPLAEDIQEQIVERLGTKDLGVKENPSLYVLRRTNMPALLVELAFVTNKADAELLRDEQYQFAYAIYQGILDFVY